MRGGGGGGGGGRGEGGGGALCAALSVLLSAISHVTTAAAEVRLPPLIIGQTPGRTHHYDPESEAGITLSLYCAAYGYPRPRLKWQRNGEEIDESGKVKYYNYKIVSARDVKFHSTLEEYVDLNHTVSRVITLQVKGYYGDGDYQCVAFNPHGVALSDSYPVRKARLGSCDQREKIVEVEVGESVRVPCEIGVGVPDVGLTIARDKDRPEGLLNAKWNYEENSLSGNTRFSFWMDDEDSGHLFFSNIEPSDDNLIYAVNKYSTILDTSLVCCDVRMKIKTTEAGPRRRPPSMAHHSRSPAAATHGRPAALMCLFDALPTVHTVEWMFGDQLVADDDKYGLSDGGTVLIVRDVTRADLGEYTCRGTNSLGRKQHTILLNEIYTLPVFSDITKKLTNVNATEDETVTFTCDPEAYPAASIEWFVNGEPLVGGRYSPSPDGRSLTVVGACRRCGTPTLAVITCNASNIVGYTLTSAYLNVMDPTIIKNQTYHTVFKPGKDLFLHCKGTTDSSSQLDVDWYHNGALISKSSQDQPYLIRLHRPVPGHFVSQLTIRLPLTEPAAVIGYYYCNVSDFRRHVVSEPIYVRNGDIHKLYAAAGSVLGSWWSWFTALWWVPLVILLGVLLLIAIVWVCVRACRPTAYHVDAKERSNGLYPSYLERTDSFYEYCTPEGAPGTVRRKASMGTVSSGALLRDESPTSSDYSLDDDVTPELFNEDGSFIGDYGGTPSGEGGGREGCGAGSGGRGGGVEPLYAQLQRQSWVRPGRTGAVFLPSTGGSPS